MLETLLEEVILFQGTLIRAATWVALHNGGGTGWGEAINGGFGLVLDGTPGNLTRLFVDFGRC